MKAVEAPMKNNNDLKLEITTEKSFWPRFSVKEIKKDIKNLGLFEAGNLQISSKRMEELTKEPKLVDKITLKAQNKEAL